MAELNIQGVNSGTTVGDRTAFTTTSDFRSNYIAKHNFMVLPSGQFFKIVEIDERNDGTFYVSPAYTGGAIVGGVAWILPLHLSAVAAEGSILKLIEVFEAAISVDPFELTPGRILRVGDFGGNGQASRLTSADNLIDVYVDGEYDWSGSSPPIGAPAGGSHKLTVTSGVGNGIHHHIQRASGVSASALSYDRMFFRDSEGVISSDTGYSVRFNGHNALNPVAFSDSRPSGGITEVIEGEVKTTATLYDTVGDMKYRAEKHLSGKMTLVMEVVLDVSLLENEIVFPVDFDSVSIINCTGYSVTNRTPNPALLNANITATPAYSNKVFVQIDTVGTQPGTPTNDERLRITIEGKW